MNQSLARVCQTSGDYTPALSSCRNLLNTIQQKNPKYIYQGQQELSCKVLGSYNGCVMNYCAFPGQYTTTQKYVDAVNDILNNCQAPLKTNPSNTQTGGYNIIVGTNSTVGVFNDFTPQSHFCATNPSISPNTTDCVNIAQSYDRTKPVTQTSRSGCTNIVTNGTCVANYCAPYGSQMSGTEYWYNLASVLYWCSNSGVSAGTIQVDSYVNVSMYASPAQNRLPVVVQKPTVCSDDAAGPAKPDCSKAATAIQSAYPNGIKQNRTSSGCTVVGRVGSCQAEYCAKSGTSISTPSFLQYFNNITGSCKAGSQSNDYNTKVGGFYQLPDSSVVVNSVEPPKNIVCDTSPNISPLINDCINLANALDKNKVYNHTSTTTTDSACSIIATNGTCKLNYCSPLSTTFTGQELYDGAVQIAFGCNSVVNNKVYTSGTWQVNANSNMSLYDPPGTPGKIDYTTDEIRQLFTRNDAKYNPPPSGTCWFYHGSFKDDCIEWAASKQRSDNSATVAMTLYDYFQVQGQDGWPFNMAADPFYSYQHANPNMTRKWFQDTSRAYAEACTGDVRFVWDGVQPLTLTDASGNVVWTSIWLTDEYPQNGGWGKIYRVDPANGQESDYTPPTKRDLEHWTTENWQLTRRQLDERDGISVGRDHVYEDEKPTAVKLNKRIVGPPTNLPHCDEYCNVKEIIAYESPNVEGTVFAYQNTIGYTPDRCGFHLIQHQKPDPSKDSYSYDVRLQDGEGEVQATASFTLPSQQSYSVISALPYQLIFTSGNVDADPVKWEYAGFKTDTGNTAVCSQGAYDSGARQIDCSFQC